MFSDCLPIYTNFVFYYRYLRRRDVAQAQGEYILIIVWAISMTSYFSFTAHETELRPALRVGEHGRFALVRPARGVLQLPPPYPAKVREHHLRREAEQVQLERLRRVSLFSFPYGQLV